MSTEADQTVTLADVEAALWYWGRRTADQTIVDEVLSLVQQYAESASPTGHAVTREADRIIAAVKVEADRIFAPSPAPAQQPATGPESLCPGCRAAVAEAAAKRQEQRPPRPSRRRARVPETNRRCSACSVVKGIDRFNRDVKARNGRKPQCKDCEADQRKSRRTVAKAKAEGKRELSVKVAS